MGTFNVCLMIVCLLLILFYRKRYKQKLVEGLSYRLKFPLKKTNTKLYIKNAIYGGTKGFESAGVGVSDLILGTYQPAAEVILNAIHNNKLVPPIYTDIDKIRDVYGQCHFISEHYKTYPGNWGLLYSRPTGKLPVGTQDTPLNKKLRGIWVRNHCRTTPNEVPTMPPQTCTCLNGVPSKGTDCIVSGHHCTSCSKGYTLDKFNHCVTDPCLTKGACAFPQKGKTDIRLECPYLSDIGEQSVLLEDNDRIGIHVSEASPLPNTGGKGWFFKPLKHPSNPKGASILQGNGWIKTDSSELPNNHNWRKEFPMVPWDKGECKPRPIISRQTDSIISNDKDIDSIKDKNLQCHFISENYHTYPGSWGLLWAGKTGTAPPGTPDTPLKAKLRNLWVINKCQTRPGDYVTKYLKQCNTHKNKQQCKKDQACQYHFTNDIYSCTKSGGYPLCVPPNKDNKLYGKDYKKYNKGRYVGLITDPTNKRYIGRKTNHCMKPIVKQCIDKNHDGKSPCKNYKVLKKCDPNNMKIYDPTSRYYKNHLNTCLVTNDEKTIDSVAEILLNELDLYALSHKHGGPIKHHANSKPVYWLSIHPNDRSKRKEVVKDYVKRHKVLNNKVAKAMQYAGGVGYDTISQNMRRMMDAKELVSNVDTLFGGGSLGGRILAAQAIGQTISTLAEADAFGIITLLDAARSAAHPHWGMKPWKVGEYWREEMAKAQDLHIVDTIKSIYNYIKMGVGASRWAAAQRDNIDNIRRQCAATTNCSGWKGSDLKGGCRTSWSYSLGRSRSYRCNDYTTKMSKLCHERKTFKDKAKKLQDEISKLKEIYEVSELHKLLFGKSNVTIGGFTFVPFPITYKQYTNLMTAYFKRSIIESHVRSINSKIDFWTFIQTNFGITKKQYNNFLGNIRPKIQDTIKRYKLSKFGSALDKVVWKRITSTTGITKKEYDYKINWSKNHRDCSCCATGGDDKAHQNSSRSVFHSFKKLFR